MKIISLGEFEFQGGLRANALDGPLDPSNFPPEMFPHISGTELERVIQGINRVGDHYRNESGSESPALGKASPSHVQSMADRPASPSNSIADQPTVRPPSLDHR